MKKIIKPLLIVGLAFLAAYAGGKTWRWQEENKRIVAEYAGFTAGDFTLQGPDGEVSLHDFKGRVVLIYFGYTYCPDVCPTSLSVMGQAMKQLEGRANVKGLFISFDPERDTMEKLKAYAPFFHPEITGLTSSAPRILEVSTRYGAYYQKVERGEQDYLMDHTSRIYIIDENGELGGVASHGATPEDVVKRVERLL
ncbi:MAG: SCO family protein [Proteobacteria bacterium]|nr:SCO family protein [Pseudomonadota bacterium]